MGKGISRYVNTSPYKDFTCGDEESGYNGYHIYEKGKKKVLVSKNGRMHVWLCPSSSGDVAFYKWDGKTWVPRLKWESMKFDKLMQTEDDIIKFFKTHKQLW